MMMVITEIENKCLLLRHRAAFPSIELPFRSLLQVLIAVVRLSLVGRPEGRSGGSTRKVESFSPRLDQNWTLDAEAFLCNKKVFVDF